MISSILKRWIAAACSAALLTVACVRVPEVTSGFETGSSIDLQIDEEPVKPIPAADISADKALLGRKLFFDKRLSADNTIACVTCHSLEKGGTDSSVHSTGIGGKHGGINAPSVLNSSLNFVQFWNGRSGSLEDQVNGPTQNPKEMGSNWNQIIEKLRDDRDYTQQFQAVYHGDPAQDSVRDAIASFEKTLVTPNAPFDRYLKGDRLAIDDEQKRGYDCFKSYGCASCHQGASLGGNLYQKFGLMGDYFKDRGHVTDDDQGRYAVTHREQDLHVFKVPSLRNIALTGPYFHDGSTTSLTGAVEVMAQYQLGRIIPSKDLHSIVRFLDSLTGDQPKDVR